MGNEKETRFFETFLSRTDCSRLKFYTMNHSRSLLSRRHRQITPSTANVTRGTK